MGRKVAFKFCTMTRVWCGGGHGGWLWYLERGGNLRLMLARGSDIWPCVSPQKTAEVLPRLSFGKW